jgi:predicted O-methyltransferase YrrM
MCQGPGRWSSFGSDQGGVEVETMHFLRALVGLIKPVTILETGTFTGSSAGALALGCADNGFGHVFSIDIDAQRCVEAMEFLAKERLTTYVTIFNADAVGFNWQPDFGTIDLMFVDGGEERHKEIEHFSRYFSSNIIIVAHDAADPQYRYATLLDRFDRILLPTPTGLLLFQPKDYMYGILERR